MRFYSLSLVCLLLATTIVHAEEELTLDDNGDDMDYLDSTTKISKKTTTETPIEEDLEENEGALSTCQEKSVDGQTSYVCQRNVNDKIEQFGIRFDDDGGFFCGSLKDGKGFHYFVDDDWLDAYECGDFSNGVQSGWNTFQSADQSKNISLQFFSDDEALHSSFSYDLSTNEAQMKWYEDDGQCHWTVAYDKTGNEKLPNKKECH